MILPYFTFAKRLNKRRMDQFILPLLKLVVTKLMAYIKYSNFHPIVSLYNVTLFNLGNILKDY